MPGEAVPKHIAILSITGKDFKVDTIRLKSVRPFVMKEIVLAQEKGAMKLAKKANNRSELTRFLQDIVDEMIEQANQEWEEAQGEDEDRDEDAKPPLPLIRLRVEYTAPEGGNFDCENPQRFSNRFVERVANATDVVQFYRKKSGGVKKAQNGAELPEESMLASLTLDSVKVEKLVREFLTAQSLTILPQNSFGDAVSQFVDKDDKHAVELFVTENLVKQVEQLMKMDNVDEDNIREYMEEGKSHLEELFASGYYKRVKKTKLNPRPDGWDSELEGAWEANPASINRSNLEDHSEPDDDIARPRNAAKGRGKTGAPKRAAAPAKKAAPARGPRSRKKAVESESEEEDEDIAMEDEDESQLFVQEDPPPTRAKRAPPAKKAAPARASAAQPSKQSQLSFARPATQPRGKNKVVQELSDEISDDDGDAFEPAPSARTTRSRR